MFINISEIFVSNSKESDPRQETKQCSDDVILGKKGFSRRPEQHCAEVKHHRPKQTVPHPPRAPYGHNVWASVEVETCAYVGVEP